MSLFLESKRCWCGREVSEFGVETEHKLSTHRITITMANTAITVAEAINLMSFTYVQNIPSANNDPSTDQPNMQTNTNTINSWAQVNHVGFNTGTSGQHTQVGFPGPVTPVPTVTGEAGNLYPALVSGILQLFFVNSAGTTQVTGAAPTTTANAGTAGGTITAIDLPGKVRIYCGVGTAGSGATVIFPVPYVTTFVPIVGGSNGTGSPVLCGGTFNGLVGLFLSAAGVSGVNWLTFGLIA
jgi:hypothetical protein